MESENPSVTVGSTYYEGKQEVKKKKFNKVRSIKLSKSPTLKPSARRAKSHFRNIVVDLSSEAENSSPHSSSSSQFSSLSDAKADISKKLARPLTRPSSFKGVRTLTRMSSRRLRNSLMRKFSGGNDLDQMEKSRSTRPVNSKSDHDRFSIVSTPSSSKSTGSSNAWKMRIQASPCTPESGFSCNADRTNRTSVFSKPNSTTSPGQKAARTLTRKASLKPLRASAKSRRGSMKFHSKISQIPDSSVERATCSSTLKDSKFPDSLQVQQGGSESEGILALKVCPFSYCSLHGHRLANAPPLKRLILIRRRMLRQENRPVRREKSSGKAKKGSQKAVVGEEVDRHFSLEINAGPEAESTGFSNCGEADVKFNELSSISQMLVCKTANPLSHIEKNLSKELVKTNSESSDKEEEEEEEEEESVISKQEDGESDSVLSGSELGDVQSKAQPDENVEVRSNNGTPSASHSEPKNGQEVANKEEKENLEPGQGFFRFPPLDSKPDGSNNAAQRMQLKDQKYVRFPPLDSKPDGSNNAAQRMQLKDQKYVRMWRLMYKHAVKGGTGKVEKQPPLDGVDKTEQVGDAQILVESKSSQNTSETDQDSSDVNHEMESYQIDAVKLVQEAFDQIILPEIQEFSSDDRSGISGIGSAHEIFEQGQADGKERAIGTENTGSLKEERTSSKAGDKMNQKASKSWSNLKKILVLKRFVKALDKVKKINRGTPRYLPLQAEPEAEKISLRRQTSEERKNAEEWMLDFALQKVISNLDPAQQRKVAMLVKAFETVLPLPDFKSTPKLNVDQVKACNSLQVQTGEKTDKETDEGNSSEVSVGGTSPSAKSENEYANQASDFVKEESEDKVEFPEFEESKVIPPSNKPESFGTCLETIDSYRSFGELNGDGTKSTCDEVLHNGSFEDVQKKLDATAASKPGNVGKDISTISEPSIAGNELCDTTLESNNIVTTDSEQVDASKNWALVGDAESITERDELDSKFTQESPPSDESEPDGTTDVAQESQLEKQSYMRLWGFVYKHMMTGIAAKEGNNLQDEADEERVVNTKPLSTTDVPEKDEDTSGKDEAADNQEAALQRFEAIKLIEKAIDEILLPENQDNSTGCHFIPDEDSQSKEIRSGTKPFISDSTSSSRESVGESDKTEGVDCRVPEHEERGTISNGTALQDEQKMSSKKQMPRSWSNLKKMILLNRFIKALENIKKFNPSGPRFLPLEADQEAEKVNLKPLELDEKRSAEAWMLDYALQQAVTRLTPARKRKVKLLVEAFETIRS